MFRFSALVLAAVLLAGCGSASSQPKNSTSTTPASSPVAAAPSSSSPPATTAAEAKSARGNLIKIVGQEASLTYKDETVARFTVKAITVNAKCTQDYAPTPKGHIVVLTIDAKTTPALANDPMKTFSLNIFGWKVVTDKGTTVNGTSVDLFCLKSDEQFPSSLGPAEHATGKIAFDVPTAAGTLIYITPGAPYGWEWEYPAK
jgi:hypothetical protein